MKIIVDNSYSKIVDITEEDEKILEIIDSTLSCYQSGYQFSDAYQMGVWDGKVRFLNKRNYTFPSGLLNVVKEVIPESVEIVYNITPFDIEVPEEINLLEPNAEKGYITLRDYQRNAVEEALKKTRGIINVATNGGKCVTKDTMILTQNGYKSVEKIFEENGTPCENIEKVIPARIPLVNRYGKIEFTSHITFNGIKKVRKILTDSGLELKATYNHPLLIVTQDGEFKWKKVEDLETGDLLVTRIGDNVYGNNQTVTSEEEAYCLGVIIADGYIGQRYKIGVANDQEVVLKAIEDYLNSIASSEKTRENNKRVRREDYTKQKGSHVTLFDTEAVERWHKRFGIPYGTAKDKEIPSCIMEAPKNIQLAFLSGFLECECSITPDRTLVEIPSASKKLLFQLLLLLRNMGIYATLRQSKKPSIMKKYPGNYYGTISIRKKYALKLFNLLSFRTEQRKTQVKKAIESYENKSNHRFPKERIPSGRKLVKDYADSYKHRISVGKYMSYTSKEVHRHKLKELLEKFPDGDLEIKQKIERLIDENFFYDEIVEITDCGEEPTFDVCMPETHSFIGNGIINHNTEIAAGIIQLLYSKLKKGQTILFVTHNKEIFHQSANRLEKRLDIEIGKVGDGYWNVKPVTVVMIPTVSRYIKKPKIQPLKPQQYKGEFKAIKLLVDLVGKNKLTADGIRNLVSVLEKENDSTCMLAIDILGRIYDTGNYDQEFKKLREALKEYEMKRQSKSFEKYNKTMDLLKSAICFIGDECHHASSSTWYDTLMLCENAVYRFGLTGTVDKSDEVNYLRLLGCMGEVVYKISNDFLIKRGYSAKPTIYFTEIKKPELKSDNWLRLYKEGIVENEYRNRKIAEQVAKHCEQGDSCLVIVNHTTHGRKLKELIEEKGVLVEFTHGNRSSFDRDRLLNELRDGKLQCLIATTILDEGVDVSNIDALWLAAGGRSMRQVLQRIGRGLRVGKNKNSVSVYDFLDLMHPLLAKHTKERYMIYKKEKFKIKKLE